MEVELVIKPVLVLTKICLQHRTEICKVPKADTKYQIGDLI